MKLQQWIQANWKTLLLLLVLLLLLDIDLQLHSLNSRSRRIANAVNDLNGRITNLEDSAAIIQEDLDEATGHSPESDQDEGGRTQN